MALERELTRIQLDGDKDAARSLINDGMKLLGKVRECVRLSGFRVYDYVLTDQRADGTIIHAVFSRGQEKVYIYSPPAPQALTIPELPSIPLATGFICHARTDTFPGGIDPTGKALPNVYTFPLVDNDHGSFLISPNNQGAPAESYTVSREPENYGNLDWVQSPGLIFSWRGPASRHFPMDATISYPGFTFPLPYPTGDVDYFTPFTSNIYQGGNVVETLPGSLVTGVGITYGVLTVMASTLRGAGYFDEAWQLLPSGWTKIWAQLGAPPEISWFFSSDGTAAYRGLETIVFTNKGTVASYTNNKNAVVRANVQAVFRTRWSNTSSGAWTLFKEGATNAFSIVMNASDESNLSEFSAQQYLKVPIYILENAAPGPVTITGPINYGGPGAYIGGGGYGGYTFTYPPETACGTQTVTVTDICGGTASMQVLMNNGNWTLVSSVAINACPGVATSTTYCTTGVTMYEEIWSWQYNSYIICNGCDGSDTPFDNGPLCPSISGASIQGAYICTVCGAPFQVTFNQYPYMCTRNTYSWEC